MRSSSLARVVIASLGVSVVITLGCGTSPGLRPSGPFSVRSISPTEGSIAGGTRVVIAGTGFIIRGQAGASVIVDGKPVDASSSSPDGNTISLTMPSHAAGKVDVTVIGPLGQAQASVPGGYTYVDLPPPPPPVIRELRPNTGSTAGGVEVVITGTRVGYAVTVTVDGIVTPFETGIAFEDSIYLFPMPAHAAGTVDVIVTDQYGQTGSSEFTYASPATFDFNGDWEGVARTLPPHTGRIQEYARLVLTIRDNIVGSVLCSVCQDEICAIGSAPSLTLDPPPVVANGEFSFAGSGGSITGHILTSNFASGSINMAPCGSRQWTAQKKR